MAFKYADAYIDMSLKDDSVITGLNRVDSALAKATGSADAFGSQLARVATHGTDLSRSIGGMGDLLTSSLAGFATGGAAGVGIAALSATIPVVVDSVSKMGEAFGFSNKNIVDHTAALEAATARAKDYAAAAKSANDSWAEFRDRLKPGEAEAGADRRNDPKTSVDKNIDEHNKALGAMMQRQKELRQGRWDEYFRNIVLERAGGMPASEEQIQKQVEKEKAKAAKQMQANIEQTQAQRDQLLNRQIAERDDMDKQNDMKLRAAKDQADQERNQRAADEAGRKLAIEQERKRRLADQAGTNVPRNGERERFPGLGASAAPAFSAQRGDIGSMWSAIQQGISNGEGLRLQKEAAEAAKNANNLLKDVNANAAKMVDKLDKLNIQARAQ